MNKTKQSTLSTLNLGKFRRCYLELRFIYNQYEPNFLNTASRQD